MSFAQYCDNSIFAQRSDMKTWQLKPIGIGFNFALVLELMTRAKFIKSNPCTVFSHA